MIPYNQVGSPQKDNSTGSDLNKYHTATTMIMVKQKIQNKALRTI